jgi:PPOX class probable F420-dependent enzyme
MPSRRDHIAMSPEQVKQLLEEQRIIVVATWGRDGWPHLMPLWYVLRDGVPWIFTYRKSQKVRNLERDPRATLLVEAGEAYHELLGVMLQARAVIHRDSETVEAVAQELFARYDSGDREGLGAETREAVRSRAAKRVAVQFHVERTLSWDHSKLGGTY